MLKSIAAALCILCFTMMVKGIVAFNYLAGLGLVLLAPTLIALASANAPRMTFSEEGNNLDPELLRSAA